jgi:hypothetical protein
MHATFYDYANNLMHVSVAGPPVGNSPNGTVVPGASGRWGGVPAVVPAHLSWPVGQAQWLRPTHGRGFAST